MRKLAPMKAVLVSVFASLSIFFCLGNGLAAEPELVYAKDGSGVYGYKDTPKLPWCEYVVHDPDRPAPSRVNPGRAPAAAPIPADAIVLFGGKDLAQWRATEWKLENAEIVAAAGSLTSKESFGDMQLH